MLGRKVHCRVLENAWITPTVFRLRFTAEKPFSYEAGQYVSVVIPSDEVDGRDEKRLYSLASPPEEARENGYEIVVKFVAHGKGSEYLSRLRAGDELTVFAPYGEFKFVAPAEGRSVCFITTGTGIGPIRSMALSAQFLDNPPPRALCLMGSRNEEEILYRKVFEAVGIETVHALSEPSPEWQGFTGRVTDYLKSSKRDWTNTDFYLCGSPEMVESVRRLLVDELGVSPTAIRSESFTPARRKKARAARKRFSLRRWLDAAFPVFEREAA